MRGKSYTFFIASTPGKLRKVVVPAYVLHGIAVLALIGSITVMAAVGSYSRMLWKVGNYNALRHDQETLKKQYQQLQSTVTSTNQRLDSLQSLATEVAMTYGVLRYHPAAFDQSDNPVDAQDAFDRSIEQYTFLKRNAAVIAISSSGLHLLSPMSFADSSYTPSIWPVMGHISDSFGERLDPFSGEGAFHTGVDVASDYGAPVHATADGIINIAGNHAGYGRLVVIGGHWRTREARRSGRLHGHQRPLDGSARPLRSPDEQRAHQSLAVYEVHSRGRLIPDQDAAFRSAGLGQPILF
jgi:hypothetical protein